MVDDEDETKEDEEENEDEGVDEEEEPENTSPDASKQIVEGIGYLGGLIEELTSAISDNFTIIQEKMDRMNNTLDEIKKMKPEQTPVIPQAQEKPDKKTEHHSTLSESAKKIKAQAEKEKEGTDNGPKHPGRGKYPRHAKRGSTEDAGEQPKGSDGGATPAPEQSHNDSPKPDMGTVPSDSQSEANPR